MQNLSNQTSTIIMLMGVSSVGKTSIANALQAMTNNAFTIVGFDHFVEKHLDKQYWPGGTHEKEGFYYTFELTPSGKIPKLQTGPIGKQTLEKMINDIIAQAQNGKNLIIDFVMSADEHQKIMQLCKECIIIQAGIKPPLSVVLERESARGDRQIGIAEAIYKDFYINKHFDVIVDSSMLSPSESANEILRVLTQNDNKRFLTK